MIAGTFIYFVTTSYLLIYEIKKIYYKLRDNNLYNDKKTIS